MAGSAVIGNLAVNLGLETAQFSNGLKKVQGQADKSLNSMKVAAGLAAKAFVALGAAMSVGALSGMADEWSDLSSQVGVAIGNMEAAPAVMERIAQVARSSYSSLSQTAQQFAQNSITLKNLGYNVEDTLRFTEALNNALVATATRGQRAEQVQYALSKALATGKLEAEGLQSILTHGGAVAETLAKHFGKTTNELYALQKSGKLTGETIAKAIIGNFDELQAKAESMPATLADGMQIIRNSLLQVVGVFDKAGGMSETLATRFVAVGDAIADNAGNIVRVLNQIVATAAVAAALFSGKFAISVGVSAVTAIKAAVVQTIALNMALGATSKTSALMAGAIKGVTVALGFMKRMLITLGIPALIIGLGYLAERFWALSKRVGGFSEALKMVGEVGRQFVRGFIQGLSAMGDSIASVGHDIRSLWAGDSARRRAQELRESAIRKESTAWDGLKKAVGDIRDVLSEDLPTPDLNLDKPIAAVSTLSDKSKEAAEKLKNLKEEFAALQDRLLPEHAATRQHGENIELIQKAARAGIEMAASMEELEQASRIDLMESLGLERLPATLDDSAKRMAALGEQASDHLSRFGDRNAAVVKEAAEAWEKPFKDMAEFGDQIARNLSQAIVYGQSLGKALVTSIRAAVAEAMASSIGRALFGDGTLGGGGGLFGSVAAGLGKMFGGGFANGGNPPVGKISVVGERGPELFIPRTRGTIIPNDALGGGITIMQTIAPNFAGNAATREEVAQMGVYARQSAIQGVREAMNRRGPWR